MCCFVLYLSRCCTDGTSHELHKSSLRTNSVPRSGTAKKRQLLLNEANQLLKSCIRREGAAYMTRQTPRSPTESIKYQRSEIPQETLVVVTSSDQNSQEPFVERPGTRRRKAAGNTCHVCSAARNETVASLSFH